MLLDVLATHSSAKVADYFTEDGVIILNQQDAQGIRQISQRLEWIKDKIFAYIELRDGKISRYEAVTISLDEDTPSLTEDRVDSIKKAY